MSFTAADQRSGAGGGMGSDESKLSSFKPILKHQKSESGLIGSDRRFSAPVIYGKASAGKINIVLLLCAGKYKVALPYCSTCK